MAQPDVSVRATRVPPRVPKRHFRHPRYLALLGALGGLVGLALASSGDKRHMIPQRARSATRTKAPLATDSSPRVEVLSQDPD